MKNKKYRPKRIFYNDKKGKYYYIIHNKKKYMKVDNSISKNKLININIKNTLGYVSRKKKKVKKLPGEAAAPSVTSKTLAFSKAVIPNQISYHNSYYNSSELNKFSSIFSEYNGTFFEFSIFS